jgi:predicted AlkP superfamily phosphohydrolase/phosphomutase
LGDAAKKVFIISLDGATFDVLLPLMQQGYMPNLQKMISQSLSSNLESVVPAVTAPAWTSFMTGKHPGKHGLFGFTQFDPADGRVKLTNARNIRSKTIWQILSDKGKRCIVLNLPYTTPPYPINGIMVSGWDSPVSNFAYPEELSNQILKMMPDYRSNLNLWMFDYMPGKSESTFDHLLETLVHGCQQGAQLAMHFLDREDWDVFMVHFQQTDWIQHRLWGYIQDACRNAANKDSKIEGVRECYRQFDAQVGILLRKIEGMDPITIILSDHGFGDYKGELFPNYYLNLWGYYHDLTEAEDKLRPIREFVSRHKLLTGIYRSVADIKHTVENAFIFKRYKKFNSWVDFADGTFGGRALPVDWGRTKVATVGAYEAAFLYVNVVGRGPKGTVQPGTEYEGIIADLIARFSEVRHPITGEKVYLRVTRGSDIYPHTLDGILLPDVILLPVGGYGFSTRRSDALPQATSEGTHRHNGVLLIHGEGLKRSLSSFDPCLVDMAPTILHMLGLPVPADMDGRVLEEIFISSRTVQYEQVDNAISQAPSGYLAAEAEVIEQRLKALGYVE